MLRRHQLLLRLQLGVLRAGISVQLLPLLLALLCTLHLQLLVQLGRTSLLRLQPSGLTFSPLLRHQFATKRLNCWSVRQGVPSHRCSTVESNAARSVRLDRLRLVEVATTVRAGA